MVTIPKHKERREEEQKEREEVDETPRSHETKDSTERDKAAQYPETYGNEWDESAAGV